MARILVIDDTKNIRKMVGLTLQKAQHQVEEAADGAQGLELFGDGQAWDLTLVDQQMPEFAGHEVVAEARRRDPTARLVMMTAFATPELAGVVLEAGAVDFLRKPFSTEILRGAVEHALARPRQAVTGFSAPIKSGSSPPAITFAINGFDFWGATPFFSTLPPGIEISRTFFVRQGLGPVRQCLIVVVPHISEEIRHVTQRDFAGTDFLWDKVCDLAMSDYLFHKAELPPALLPIFELTPMQLFAIRKLSGMKPFLNF